MQTAIGYSHLVATHTLRTLPLRQVAYLDTSVRGRKEQMTGDLRLLLFEPRYAPEDTLAGHLQFALRYEGVNLQVLALLFERTGEAELTNWITERPASVFARRACFLYEWLTGRRLPVDDPVAAKERYVDALDTGRQFAVSNGEKSPRFRITNNLPGNPAFCPLVSRTPFIDEMLRKNLRKRTRETLERYDPDLLRRAAAFLYLKETQSSFEVEREKPSPHKAQRFADLLRQADTQQTLDEERLTALQNVVVDPRFHEFTWRARQNWIGKDYGHRQQVDFVPPRPADVPELMAGLIAMTARLRENFESESPIDAVVAAAMISFGFVFIHPFMDGNGRIHRYLIHDVLTNAGFTPRGIVLPVSAVILANLHDYVAVLERFSKPINRLTDFNADVPDIPATGNDAVYFRYFDATEQAEFLYRALERTVEEDLQQEIEFLLGFDRARQALNELLDWPGHSLDLFIRVVRQNGYRLSESKRKRHFEWMTSDEIALAEAEMQVAFGGRSRRQPEKE